MRSPFVRDTGEKTGSVTQKTKMTGGTLQCHDMLCAPTAVTGCADIWNTEPGMERRTYVITATVTGMMTIFLKDAEHAEALTRIVRTVARFLMIKDRAYPDRSWQCVFRFCSTMCTED